MEVLTVQNVMQEQQVELLPMLGERKNLPQAELLGNQLFVPSNLTDDELRGYLEPYDNKRVCIFDSCPHRPTLTSRCMRMKWTVAVQHLQM